MIDSKKYLEIAQKLVKLKKQRQVVDKQKELLINDLTEVENQLVFAFIRMVDKSYVDKFGHY